MHGLCAAVPRWFLAPLTLAPSFYLPSLLCLTLCSTHLCLDGSNRVPEDGGLMLSSGWTLDWTSWVWMCSVSEAGKWYCPCPSVMMLQTSRGWSHGAPPPSLIQGLSISTVTVAIPWVLSLPCVGNIDLLALLPRFVLSFVLDSAKCVAFTQPHVRIMCIIKYRYIKSYQHTWKHITFLRWRRSINFCSTNMKQDILRV